MSSPVLSLCKPQARDGTSPSSTMGRGEPRPPGARGTFAMRARRYLDRMAPRAGPVNARTARSCCVDVIWERVARSGKRSCNRPAARGDRCVLWLLPARALSRVFCAVLVGPTWGSVGRLGRFRWWVPGRRSGIVRHIVDVSVGPAACSTERFAGRARRLSSPFAGPHGGAGVREMRGRTVARRASCRGYSGSVSRGCGGCRYGAMSIPG